DQDAVFRLRAKRDAEVDQIPAHPQLRHHHGERMLVHLEAEAPDLPLDEGLHPRLGGMTLRRRARLHDPRRPVHHPPGARRIDRYGRYLARTTRPQQGEEEGGREDAHVPLLARPGEPRQPPPTAGAAPPPCAAPATSRRWASDPAAAWFRDRGPPSGERGFDRAAPRPSRTRAPPPPRASAA